MNLFFYLQDFKMSVSYKKVSDGKIKVFNKKNVNRKNLLLTYSRICVDGNIGSGKTTFTQTLFQYLRNKNIKTQVIEEDMSNKEKTLNLFINDQKKYAFAFQLMMLSERINIYRWSLPKLGETVIIDRSIVGDRAFKEYHHGKGNINDEESVAYDEMITQYADKDFFRVPELYLYLKVSPEVAYERICKRNRAGEKNGYTLEYLRGISENHEQSFHDLGVDYIEIEWNEMVELDEQGFLPECIMEDVFNKIIDVRLEQIS